MRLMGHSFYNFDMTSQKLDTFYFRFKCLIKITTGFTLLPVHQTTKKVNFGACINMCAFSYRDSVANPGVR